MDESSNTFLRYCRSITAKRLRTVINHILEHGSVSTEELREVYGYSHPPRAARDVRELGIPLRTFIVTGSDGRKIAAYKFGDLSKFRLDRSGGRTSFSNAVRQELIQRYGSKCFIYLEEMQERNLQIDHRIPYEVAGELIAY